MVQPEPEPTSRTRSPGRTSSSRSIAETVLGWELVCPWPMSSGPSYDAWPRRFRGRNSSRGRPRRRRPPDRSRVRVSTHRTENRAENARAGSHWLGDQAPAAAVGGDVRPVDVLPRRGHRDPGGPGPQPGQARVGPAGPALPTGRIDRLAGGRTTRGRRANCWRRRQPILPEHDLPRRPTAVDPHQDEEFLRRVHERAEEQRRRYEQSRRSSSRRSRAARQRIRPVRTGRAAPTHVPGGPRRPPVAPSGPPRRGATCLGGSSSEATTQARRPRTVVGRPVFGHPSVGF